MTFHPSYDPYGMLLSETDPATAVGSRVTTFSYDPNHNQTSRSDATGTVRYDYDGGGHQTTVTNTLGQATSTTYNPYGGPTTIVQHDGGVTALALTTFSVGYDDNFLPTGVTDGNGQYVGGYAFDSRGSILTRYDGNHKATGFTLDPYGNRASTTDPLANTLNYNYDTLGRMTVITDTLNFVSRYDYDALGRLITATAAIGDPAQAQTQYRYCEEE